MKRRRIDSHVRMMTVSQGALDRELPTCAEAARAHGISRQEGLKLMQSEVAAMRAVAHLSVQGSQAFAVTIDAARFGKPAREMLLGALSCVDKQVQLHLAAAGRACDCTPSALTNRRLRALPTNRRLPPLCDRSDLPRTGVVPGTRPGR